MAEDESPQHPHPASSAARRDREIIRTERSYLSKLGSALRLADFMAILMVLATFFSAYATWRTALVTSAVFAVADRPFLGVQQVSLEATDTDHPTIVVNFKNFGSIPALDTIVSVHAVVDGKVVKISAGAMSAMDAGIISPTVPHFFYASLPQDAYRAVAAGESNLQVHVSLVYKAPAHQTQLCYFERMAYDFRMRTFQASGGTDRCGTDIF
ncbi:MAG: hypothetical protein WCA22_05765 [Candidatus Binatus sp.]